MSAARIIVVAIDFSEHSDKALDTAIEMARAREAELHVVHAFDLPIPVVSPYEVPIPDEYWKASRDAAAKRLSAARDRARAAGLDAQSHMLEVPAAPAIAGFAEEVGADLVVVGTRGRTGVKHFLLGSVAERTLRLAPCSVLAVKGGSD